MGNAVDTFHQHVQAQMFAYAIITAERLPPERRETKETIRYMRTLFEKMVRDRAQRDFYMDRALRQIDGTPVPPVPPVPTI